MIKMPIYIVIGTRAQFIKVAPLMSIMQTRKIPYSLIYTAQHRESIDEILKLYELPQPEITLFDQIEANTKGSFFKWFISILFIVLFKSKSYISVPGILLTHGDTFTAWLGALMGKRAGCTVGHIESGFRLLHLPRTSTQQAPVAGSFQRARVCTSCRKTSVSKVLTRSL